MNSQSNPPSGWNVDVLARFFEQSHQNIYATFANSPALWKLLSEIDQVFQSYADICISHAKTIPNDDPSGLLLLTNANNHLRSAFRSCCSGHSAAVYPAGRAALENALYGWYLLSHPGACVRWHSKPQSGKALRQWATEFSFGEINRKLAKVAADTAEAARLLHEDAISLGSHPNREALYTNVEIRRLQRGTSIRHHLLHGWDSAFALSTRFASAVGLASLQIVRHADPDGASHVDLLAKHDILMGRYKILVAQWESEFDPQ